jgi:SHS2 domain-containing protein
MKRYEYIEHTADIVARAYGDSLDEAFAAAAEAMFGVIAGQATVRATRPVTLRVESIDLAGLLVAFLSELIVINETDSLVLTDFTVRLFDDTHLEASAGAEEFDPGRHSEGMSVKGISYHMLEIERGSGGQPCMVQVLFDV